MDLKSAKMVRYLSLRPHKPATYSRVLDALGYKAVVDTEGIFNTVKTNIPELLLVAETIRQDVIDGKLDTFLSD